MWDGSNFQLSLSLATLDKLLHHSEPRAPHLSGVLNLVQCLTVTLWYVEAVI